MAVTLDVPVLAADGVQDEVLVGAIRDAAWRGRLDVDEASLSDGVFLPVDGEGRRAAEHEVELVLHVVEVLRALVPRREGDEVDPECGDTERFAHLAEPVPLPELLVGRDRIAHARDFTPVDPNSRTWFAERTRFRHVRGQAPDAAENAGAFRTRRGTA